MGSSKRARAESSSKDGPTKADVKAAKKASQAEPANATLAKVYKNLKRTYNDTKKNDGVTPASSLPQEDSTETSKPAAAEEEYKFLQQKKFAKRGGKHAWRGGKPLEESEEKAPDVAKKVETELTGVEGDTVFVGNLPWTIDDDAMKEVLHTVVSTEEILNIRWGTDKTTGSFRGFGHVQLSSAEAAGRVVGLDGSELLGRPMKVNIDVSGTVVRKSTSSATPSAAPAPASNPGNVDRCFCGNLPFDIDQGPLFKAFHTIGASAAHVFWVTDKTSGQFYGSAFVTFATPEDAAVAVASNGMDMSGRPVRIEYSAHKDPERAARAKGPPPKPPSERPEGGAYTAFFGNLSYELDDDTMKKFCEDAGAKTIKSIRWLTHQDSGDFRGAGFIDFEEVGDVDKMVACNGKLLLGRGMRVDYA